MVLHGSASSVRRPFNGMLHQWETTGYTADAYKADHKIQFLVRESLYGSLQCFNSADAYKACHWLRFSPCIQCTSMRLVIVAFICTSLKDYHHSVLLLQGRTNSSGKLIPTWCELNEVYPRFPAFQVTSGERAYLNSLFICILNINSNHYVCN